MRVRHALLAGTTAAVFTAGCQPNVENGQPEPLASRTLTNFRFVSDPAKSDVYLAVNCKDFNLSKQKNYGVSAEVLTPTAPDASVIITLGVTDQEAYEGKISAGKLLGGVSVRGAQGRDTIAYSDDSQLVTTTPETVASKRLLIGGQPVSVSFYEDPSSHSPVMSLECLPPLSPTSA